MIKKYTKKIKQSGSGFRIKSRLRNLFGRKKPEARTPKTLQKKQASNTKKKEDNQGEKKGFLDKLFMKLCTKKLERYEKNREEEKKGILYTACYKINPQKFDEIDKKINNGIDNQFDQYVQKQMQIRDSRSVHIEDLSTNERELFIIVDTLLKKIDLVEVTFFEKVVSNKVIFNDNYKADPIKKDREQREMRQAIEDCEKNIQSILSDIQDLYEKRKILFEPTLSHFNKKYDILIDRFKYVLSLITNNKERNLLKLKDFKLNNKILNSSGKRIFTPSNEKIDKEKNIIEKLSNSLKMQDFAISRIENQYNTQVQAELTKNKNHTNPDLVARFIDQLKYMQKEFRYINSKYKQLSNEQNTYKNNLSNLKSLKELYTSVYNKFTILFNTIVTENKLELPKIGLNNNIRSVPVSPL